MSNKNFKLQPGGALRGTVCIPGDKSISHRAIMFSALAEGTSHITGFLESADCLATLHAFESMGVKHELKQGAYTIHGLGMHGLEKPAGPLDLGNSGTSMRLMSGVMAGQRFDSVLTGDASLSRRPMGRVIEPLQQMGARIKGNENHCAPLVITGQTALTAIDYAPPVASAQIKSCVLLAGLYANGTTQIHEPGVSRDHTERMLTAFGVELVRQPFQIAVTGGQKLQAVDISVPADLSSAAFFMLGAAIAPDSDITLPGVGINPTRRGVIDVMLAMGADITLENEREQGGEPVADIRIRSSELQGVDIGAREVELAIDECPALFVAAACARGTTRVSGAGELRVKECDRIAVMARGLTHLGIECTETRDGLIIQGRPEKNAFGGGRLASHEDHRIAMAFSMAALRASDEIVIEDCDYVDTSFPGFMALAARAGLDIESTI